MRIISLLPAATELVVGLELRYALVGRTHECDHPPAVRNVPVMTSDLLPSGLDPRSVDRAVKDGIAESSTIYRLDEDALVAAEPDVIISQTTCAVCAVDGSHVERAVAHLAHEPRILTHDPHRLDDITAAAERLGRSLGDTRAGLALRSHLERRIDFVRRKVDHRTRPRVAVVEWPDPLFGAGHWVPDAVDAAGGEEVFGSPGDRSRERTWDDLVAARPEVVILSFCGYDLATSIRHAGPLVADGRLAALDHPRLIAVDGSAWLSRPGPRIVDGIEALAAVLHDPHPDLRPAPGMVAELHRGMWRDPFRV
jgi:iron complex transport system substrate-binding protein